MFTDIWSFIAVWYNLPFTILLGLCLVLAVFQLLGLSNDHDSEADTDLDHDVDIDHDVDVEHDVELEHSADVEHDVDQDVDQTVEHTTDSDTPSTLTLLAFLGIGKAPLVVVMLILFGSIGILGWTLNGILRLILGQYAGLGFIAVLPVAVIGGSWVSAQTARFIGRALPPISTTATRAQTLVGQRGTVISPFVDEKYGMVHLRNEGGTLISVFAVTPGAEIVRRGDEVVLVAYDSQQHRYSVAPLKPDTAHPAAQ